MIILHRVRAPAGFYHASSHFSNANGERSLPADELYHVLRYRNCQCLINSAKGHRHCHRIMINNAPTLSIWGSRVSTVVDASRQDRPLVANSTKEDGIYPFLNHDDYRCHYKAQPTFSKPIPLGHVEMVLRRNFQLNVTFQLVVAPRCLQPRT